MEPRKRAISSSLALAKEIMFDEIDDEEELMCAYRTSKKKNTRNCIKNFVEVTVSNYSLDEFKKQFRLKRGTFEVLLGILEPKLVNETGRPPVDAKKKLLSVIWFLSKQETFSSVAERFDLSTSMLHNALQKICKILADMASKFIHWPTDLQATENNFREISGFPGVVGAIDGCHIAIKAPGQNPERYFNRKKSYSLILQAVANRDLTFTDVFCSLPGSVHDARVFSKSDIPAWCGNRHYFPDHCHLIGDSAYPLLINLMVPYKDNGHLGRRQRIYNKKLSQTRVCVERAFGLLKCRFRRLKYFDAKVKDIPLYVLACCILHNVCIRENDIIDDSDDDDNEDNTDDDDDDDDTVDGNASNKRDYICGLL